MDSMVDKYAIITVRNSSSRLVNKAIREIQGRKTIEIVIERAKRTGCKVVIATSTDKSDDIIEQIARDNMVEIFRGALLNKLKRWEGCFEKFNIERALLVDGDDLMYDYDIARRAIERLKAKQIDIIKHPGNIVCGFFTYAMNRNAFEKMTPFTSSDKLDTDVITEFLLRSDLITEEINLNQWEKDRPYRLTLDYKEDLQMFEELISRIGVEKNGKEIIEFLDKNQDVWKININRQKDFLENQQKFNQSVAGRL